MGRIEPDRRSPEFLTEFVQNETVSSVSVEQVLNDVKMVIQQSDADQAAYSHSALTGVLGAIAVLDGYEGCRKTTTQSRLFYAFLRLGLKVLVVTQSNTAADVAITSFINLNNNLLRPCHRQGQVV